VDTLYTNQLPVTAVHLMNDVIPAFEVHGARIKTALSALQRWP
jgi:hypothetical protein